MKISPPHSGELAGMENALTCDNTKANPDNPLPLLISSIREMEAVSKPFLSLSAKSFSPNEILQRSEYIKQTPICETYENQVVLAKLGLGGPPCLASPSLPAGAPNVPFWKQGSC